MKNLIVILYLLVIINPYESLVPGETDVYEFETNEYGITVTEPEPEKHEYTPRPYNPYSQYEQILDATQRLLENNCN